MEQAYAEQHEASGKFGGTPNKRRMPCVAFSDGHSQVEARLENSQWADEDIHGESRHQKTKKHNCILDRATSRMHDLWLFQDQ